MLRHGMVPVVACVLMLSPSLAAQSITGQPQRPPDQPRVEGLREARGTDTREHAVIRADRLIGQAVRDPGDERLGRIDDLALNVQGNRIVYAVISRGGLFGIGAEEVAVSWDELQPDMTERVVRAEARTVQQAQYIDTRTAWPAAAGRPGEPVAEQPVGTAGRDEHVREVVSVSRIIGMDVRNPQGERLGQVDDVALNRDGSVAYVVVAHGGFLGMGHNYVAVPWDRLTLDREHEQVRLNVTREQLERARQFDHGERWPERVDWPFGD